MLSAWSVWNTFIEWIAFVALLSDELPVHPVSVWLNTSASRSVPGALSSMIKTAGLRSDASLYAIQNRPSSPQSVPQLFMTRYAPGFSESCVSFVSSQPTIVMA